MKQFDSETKSWSFAFSQTFLKKQGLLLFFSIVISLAGFGADRYAVATGTWGSTATWSATSGGAPGATVPGALDNVFIEGGHTVTITGNVAATNINITSGSGLVTTTFSITLTGNWINNGTFTAGSGTVIFSGPTLTVQTLKAGTSSFNNLTHSGASTLQLINDNLIINNTLTNSAGIFDPNALDVTATVSFTLTGGNFSGGVGNLSVGNFSFSNAAIMTAPSGNFTVSGNWTRSNTASFIPGTNTVNFNGSAIQNINSVLVPFFNVIHTGSGLLQLSGSGMVTNGAFINDAGAGDFFTNGNTHSITGLTTINGGAYRINNTQTFGGGITINAGGILTHTSSTMNVRGDWTNNGGTFTPGANIVTINGSIDQTIGGTSPTTFNSLTISNSAPSVATLAADVTVSGVLTVSANANLNLASQNLYLAGGAPVFTGTFNTASSTVFYSNPLSVAVTAANYHNLNLSGGARTNSGIIGIRNVLTPGSVTALGGTVNFNGTGPQNIPALIYNILQTLTSDIKTLAGNITINNNLNIGAGTTLEPGSNIITFNNPPNNSTPFIVNGTFNPSTSTVIYNGANTLNITPINFYNLISSNNTRNVPLNGIIGIANIFTPGTTSFGNVHIIHFNGISGTQTFTPSFTFRSLTISNPNGLDISNNISVNNILNLSTGNINLGTNILTLPLGSSVIGGSGSSYVNGRLRKQIANNLPSINFEVGDDLGYAPIFLTFNGPGTNNNGFLTAMTTSGDHPEICSSLLDKTLSVNRFYSIENGLTTVVNGYSSTSSGRVNNFTSYTPVFNFSNPSDLDASVTTNNLIVRRYQSSNNTWTNTSTSARTSSSINITSLPNSNIGFGIFQIAEPEPIIATSAQSASICYNTATNILMPSSKIGVSYQLRNSVDNSLVGTPINGTGGALSFPTGILLTTTTFNVLATNTASSCAILMSNTTTVVINPGTEKTVTASPALVCVGNTAKVIVGLSQPNVKYVLRNDADNASLGDTLTGNNGNLEFNIPIGYLVSTTVFNVWAIDTVTSCAGVLINKVTITTQNFPSPVFSIEQDFCTLGQGKVILATTDSTFNSFLWSNGDPTPSIVIEQSGFYSLTVTDANGCRTTTSINIGDEKVINGNFSMGVGVGYTTGYILNQAANGLVNPGIGYYAINSNANFTHGNFWGRDHTSQTGNMMIVNGDGSNRVIWRTTVNVVPNERYYFSAWAMSLNSASPYGQLRFNINGVNSGTSAVLDAGVNNNSNSGWERFFGIWDSESVSGNITIEIVNLQTASGGNDFALDDISFSTLPPVTFFGASVGNGGNNLCLNDTLKLTATLTGGANPITYSWTGPNGFTSSDEDPVILNAQGGWYYLTAVEGRNCQSTDSIFIILSNPNVTGVTQVGKCANNNVRIALSGMVPNSLNNTIYYTLNNGAVRTATNVTSDEFGNASFLPNPILGTGNNTNILRITGIFNGSCTINFTTPPQVTLDVRPNSQSWVGGVFGDWNDATNWCPSLPGTNTDVTIPSGVTVYVNDGEFANARNLTLTGTATLELRNNATFNFYGVFSGTGKIDARRGIIATRRNNANQDISGDFFVEKAISTLVLYNTGIPSNVTITGDTLKILSALEFGNTGADLVTSDKIVLVSGDTATASIGVIPSTNNVITGNFIVERYLSNARKWRLLAAPTNRVGQTVRNSWQENGVNLPGYGFNAADTRYTATNTLGFDFAGNNSSVKRYNPTTENWDAVANTDVLPISNERGYFVFVAGDRTVTFPGSKPTKLRTVGTINRGLQTPITVPANQFATIGNPYASRIDMRNINRTAQIDSTFYVWDPSLGSFYGLGAFNTFFFDGSDYLNLLPSTLYGPALTPNNFIESGMAVMVRNKSTTASGTITFEENDKIAGSNLSSFTSNAAHRLLANLKLAPQGSNPAILLDGAGAMFNEGYSIDFNEEDIKKMGTVGEAVSWKTSNNEVVVDNRFTPAFNDTLHLQIKQMRVQNYQWELALSNMDYPGLEAMLIDRYNNTRTALNMNGTTMVNFNIQNIPGSYATDRFKIVFKQAALVLPVTITSITANRNNDKTVAVQWKVENELDLINYEVQRSEDGRDFTSIITQTPLHNNGGARNYETVDSDVKTGDLFYRIKATSISGLVQYSTIVKVAGVKTSASIIVYPNPVIGKQMQVQFKSVVAGIYQLRLLNNNGQVVYQSAENVMGGSLVRSIQLNKAVAAGRYDLIVTGSDGFISKQQVIIQ